MADQWQLFWKEIIQTHWLQWLAVGLGVAEVLFAKANKIWLYPTGIASILFSVYVLFQAGLYAECLLNGYYLIMSVYGWWYWTKKRDRPARKITRCSHKDWITVTVIAIAGFALLSFLLKNFTPSTVPFLDAWITSTAWAGMWLLAKRKLENWILLNISNAFAVPLLIYKQLPVYALLTIFLFIIAIQGYIKWYKILNEEEQLRRFSISK
jgi:nicotinamide mononucleotide transporter